MSALRDDQLALDRPLITELESCITSPLLVRVVRCQAALLTRFPYADTHRFVLGP